MREKSVNSTFAEVHWIDVMIVISMEKPCLKTDHTLLKLRHLVIGIVSNKDRRDLANSRKFTGGNGNYSYEYFH